MSTSTHLLMPSQGTRAAHRPRGLSPRLLAAPLFIALALSAAGNLWTSPDARERFAAFAVSH